MTKKPISIYKISFLHRCPACEEGGIYSALLTVEEECKKCGFKLSEHDAGDGPAFFVMFFVGIIVTILAVWTELALEVPLWVHLVLWSFVTVIMSLYLLRVVKSFLIGMQYKNNVLDFKDKK